MRVGPVLFTQFTAKLKEVRIILDPTCKASKGARKYVERFYPSLKKNNPNLAILVRECAGVQPKLWARFEKGKEVSIPLANQSAPDIHKHLEAVGR
ncbi:NADH dehydrogenase [ubiquinone] 1 alpha subcomplex subunit 2 isoform X1 [Drosophila hydei]|uniref:NADH dehydrogenase [ubiquinone] 1 alpha subcomplex subunit 2 n=1 Tax=Drosophila hydei TaxID=7224 RepID=A0A6J1LVJ3_DROHY|nr:NADH dehydrogenase [ubiquinone] 1 alpha subcomplex subunit 2 isoform X1 [Drosophila hydei]